MRAFTVDAPATVSEAAGRLRELGPAACLLAGGTAILPRIKRGDVQPAHLVWLGRVAGLRGTRRRDGELVIGALTTLHELASDPLVGRFLPAVHALLPRVANVRIRAMATLGGNLAQGDAGFDPPVLLAALSARAALATPAGVRAVDVADLTGTGGRGADEVLTEITVPIPDAGTAAAAVKHSPRSWTDRATVTAAASVTIGPDATVRAVRIALGGVAPQVVRAVDAEQMLVGSRWTAQQVSAASRAAAIGLRPVTDIRGDETYKRAMAEVFVRRALTGAGQTARQEQRRPAEPQ